MSNIEFNYLQDEDEDVILEGSDLHQALTNMGYTNFDSIPRVDIDFLLDKDVCPIKQEYYTAENNFKQKINYLTKVIYQESKFIEKQLQIILKADILLDDHASMINDLLNEKVSKLSKLFEWIPLFGSIISASICISSIRKYNIISAAALTVFTALSYKKYKEWRISLNLKNIVILQNSLHEQCKKSLRILRRTMARKSINIEIHEKKVLIGDKKLDIIHTMMQLLLEIFYNLSQLYHKCAKEIMDMSDYLPSNCILSEIDFVYEQVNHIKTYDDLKSLYYTYILAQSEMMFIMANGYVSGTPKITLSDSCKNLNKLLSSYHGRLSKLLQNYELCDVKPVRHVFRGTPSSKWQDTYIHLDLTSFKIQSAYKLIISILEEIDANSEKDENSLQFIESITEKMNEAYKHIENAKNFAEFTSLLMIKAQRKPHINLEFKSEDENLFPEDNIKKVVMSIEDQVEIEDEVFEEYIKEEYLKPLYESSEGVFESFKLDKLLKKNFMSELKEALIEKQKSMTERELKALKRMYDKLQKDANLNISESEKYDNGETLISSRGLFSVKSSPTSQSSPSSQKDSILPSTIPPPPPPPPPPPLADIIIAENDINETKQKINHQPISLPRFKTFRPEDEIEDVQRFSINKCMTSFKFPSNFKIAEETFVGSGENSDIEDDNDDDSKSDEDIIED